MRFSDGPGRRQQRSWWRALLCRLGGHRFGIYSVGHNHGKECRWCSVVGFMTPAEVAWATHVMPEPPREELKEVAVDALEKEAGQRSDRQD